MDFKIDIHKKIKGMKRSIENEWGISNNDVDILIREFEKLEKENKLLRDKLNYYTSTRDCDEEFEL